MNDEELVEQFVGNHPRLDYSALNRGATFYLCHDTWFYMVLTWARHDAEQ
ncbi:MAG: hypothetical protein HZB40_16695 [Rhodocyclales bacterium]|nr:hypothetical protein [Rhodocyclales bacterium]